jgi:SulP family sulfate permease
MIAILEAARSGLLARSQWPRNVVAGLMVGVVALPLSMAFAIASGARPEQGLYTAIIGGACVSLFGGSRVQIAGPTGAFIAILSGISAKYGIAGLELAELGIAALPADVMVYDIVGPMFFGAIENFKRPLLEPAGCSRILFRRQTSGVL